MDRPPFGLRPPVGITEGGKPIRLVGETETIFDTGTAQIVGDPDGIKKFYAQLGRYGARLAPEIGNGVYTSTWASAAVNQDLYNVCFLYYSPLQLRYTNLRLCWGKGGQDLTCFI